MKKIEELIGRIGDVPVIAGEKAVKAKSRDFFWYSPILKERLDHIAADLVVAPRHEADVVAVLSACHDLEVPVTPRGGGTGNYGQAMPLAGGVVLDMANMSAIREIRDGMVIAEPGAIIGDIDAAAREALGQELRMHPSTRETATIGGFIAGGSGGIGSIRWGMLGEAGNILRLRLVTVESAPRVLDLTGRDIGQVHHAYGVTGVMTEVAMPLAPAPEWVEMLIACPTWTAALKAGWEISATEGLWLKLVSAIEAPAPMDYFKRHSRFLEAGDNALCVMVAPNSADALAQIAEGMGGRIALRSDRAADADLKGLPHIYHLTWNHTTLRGLRVDPEITYLQAGFPAGQELKACAEIAERFPGEIVNHVEYTRDHGMLRMSCLPLVRFRSANRLQALMEELEKMGCPVWNPHVYTLEEGNRRNADPAQLALKRAVDPKGLLNPGKMIAWERADYIYDLARNYAYPDMQARPPE